MTFKIVTTSPGFGKAGDLPARLQASGLDFVRTDAAGLAAHLADADFLVAGLPRVTAETLAMAPRLRAVLKHGVGLDSIDIPACTARGIPVLNTPGANAIAVAELALAGIFALSRNIVPGHLSVTSGGWARTVGTEVEGATLGIIGFGAIGRTLARKARALEMTVLACDPFPDLDHAAKLGVSITTMETVLSQSDFVSLHVFGGADTAALIGAPQLRMMRPGACILNLARGEVLDLDALHDALVAGRIGGAAIDAYVTEPPDIRHPVFADPRVIFSPHSGADTTGSLIRMGRMVLDDIDAMLRGERPARTVNPAVWQG